jgi:Arc/MetJ family transcription regulator
MRTNIVLDDELVNEALNLTGINNKRELITLALKELIKNRQKKDLFQLAGQIELDENYVETHQQTLSECFIQKDIE